MAQPAPVRVKLPNGKDAICFPTAASVLFYDPVQLAEIIDLLGSGQFAGQKFIQVSIIKSPENIRAIPKPKTNPGEAVLVFAPPPAPIRPSSE
jgi:hypothetical protein